MKPEIQPIESIHERDIDLILLEELNTNNYFANWFVRQLELPELTKTIGTWRSISDFGLGETDLLLSYQSKDITIFVLIENKVDANFQEQQLERYQKRGEKYKSDGKCDEYFLILIAPKQYSEGQNDFERFLTYEEIRDYFEFSNNERFEFKAKLLTIAIDKLRRGYQPVNSEPVQKFWQSYWKYKEKNYPEFKSKRPSIVPFGSDWPEMRDRELENIIFYHKLGKGYIDATFCHFSKEVEYRLKEILPKSYIFIKHKSGRFSIRQKTDLIDRTMKFEIQKEKVKKGLEKMKEVRDWIIQNLK